MEIIGGLLAGAFIGAVLGFIGAGGAMLSVPILLYIFNFTPQAATTAAIAVVLSAAISGLLPKIKSKEVLFKEASIIWALGLVTNIGFSIVAHRLSDEVITTGFSFVLLTAGTMMLIKPIAGTEKKVPFFWLVVISLVIGSMTGLFGIGGGLLACSDLARDRFNDGLIWNRWWLSCYSYPCSLLQSPSRKSCRHITCNHRD